MACEPKSLAYKHTSFSESDIDAHTHGGGILPLAHDEHGVPHLLLGRERFVNQWRGSCRWAAFEGSRKVGETPLGNALREFAEETLGLVVPHDEAERLLRAGAHWLRLVLMIRSERIGRRLHTTYVLPIEWRGNLPREFAFLRSKIEHVDRLAQELAQARPRALDACEIGALLPPHTPAEPPRVWVCGEDGPRTHVASGAASAAELRTWDEICTHLERVVPSLEAHACVTVRRGARWGRVQSVDICRDHLEKDQLRWWSLDDLRQVLARRGNYGGERFRPYFLPTLQCVLDEYAARPPAAGEAGGEGAILCGDCGSE